MASTTTPETVATDTLIVQLDALSQLTRTEAQIARVRVAQARTDAVRRELRENAGNADRRAARIAAQLRLLDAVPDVVSPALGRVLALVKATVDQVQPIDEALLGDLTLEHQLRDRARYVRVLAERAGLFEVQDLADDLVAAHSETIDWLTTVLAEEALGGPSALVPTPLQRVAGGVVQAFTFPTRIAVRGAKRAVNTAYLRGEQARETVEEFAGTVVKIGSGTREVASVGRKAMLQRAERVAEREGADATADALHGTRAELGALKAAELPIKHYEEMTAQESIAALRKLSDPDELNAMIRFEESHKKRSGVISAAQTRYAAIAKDSAGIYVGHRPGTVPPFPGRQLARSTAVCYSSGRARPLRAQVAPRGGDDVAHDAFISRTTTPAPRSGGRRLRDFVRREVRWPAARAAQRIDPRWGVELRSSVGQKHVPPGVVDQPMARAAHHDAVGQRCLAALLPGDHVVHLAPRRRSAAPGAAAVAGGDRPPQPVGDRAGGSSDVQGLALAVEHDRHDRGVAAQHPQ